LIVVVAEEIQPVLDLYKPVPDLKLQKEFMNLAYVYRSFVKKEAEAGKEIPEKKRRRRGI